jgi:vesicle coat complex subunit
LLTGAGAVRRVCCAGEIHELEVELVSLDKSKRREAVKKVIAAMTVGKDVSQLFPHVLNCIQTDSLELKKLVYLYMMNYAKMQPDVAILAVNTFVKDSQSDNALIRALAVRTMGCIRVKQITEYMIDPLRSTLRDKDPYVRKTAAICVAKLYDIDPEQTENAGFLDDLRNLLSDSNPMVVANAIATLAEINDNAKSEAARFSFSQQDLNKILTALNECSEWGQVFILDALSGYIPKASAEAAMICERITPRLSHANAAVVLSTVRVIMKLIGMLAEDAAKNLARKLAPPLITLLSSESHEVQYVALRNIALIVQKRPDVLQGEIRVFFVKYNDPIYVKMEKLDVMIRLVNDQNISQVLAELKEYATEVDVDFVRKAVRAIGRCAIKIEPEAQRCVDTLVELIQTKVNYVVQEAVVVIKDIFRKYPNRYERIISTLCENLDTLDEPEAKASMIWIIGEYADRIENAGELLETFLDGFVDESATVQLQMLTAVVKLFLKNPANGQTLAQRVLQLATQEIDNPDLRDRGYIYWRLLSTDPAAAKAVVLADKPLISDETDMLEPSLLDELICNISSLASVYHKPPSTFLETRAGGRSVLPTRGEEEDEDSNMVSAEVAAQAAVVAAGGSLPPVADIDLLGGMDTSPTTTTSSAGAGAASGGGANVLDLLNDLGISSGPAVTASSTPGLGGLLGGGFAPAPVAAGPAASAGLADLFGGPGAGAIGLGSLATAGPYMPPKEVWLPAARGKGLEIAGTFVRRNRTIIMEMTFTNKALQPMTGFAVQFNKNSFGLTPAAPLNIPHPIPANQSFNVSLPLATTGPVTKMDPVSLLQVAVKNNVDVLYFQCDVPLHVVLVEDGLMDKQQFLAFWQETPQSSEVKSQLPTGGQGGADAVVEKLRLNNVFLVARRPADAATVRTWLPPLHSPFP